MESKLEEVVLELHRIGAVKFGSFKLKSGVISPIYIDLRLLPSYPKLLETVGNLMWQKAEEEPSITKEFTSLVGVPYTALPIATSIAINKDLPMLIIRKERKEYGTGNQIEGVIEKGKTSCLILEDVVTSGLSVMQTSQTLRSEEIEAKHAIVFLNREQGGTDNLVKHGVQLRSVIGIKQLLTILNQHKKLDDELFQKSLQFLTSTQVVVDVPSKPKELSYQDRIALSSSQLGKKLFELMETKKTNLALAADFYSKRELLQLADEVGPHICMLKTHVDIISDFDEQFTRDLAQLAEKHNFLIFEDRKFADIGNVVKQQYGGGIYKISEWAHISNSHVISGSSSIAGLKEIASKQSSPRGFLLIAQMSTVDANTNTSTVDISLKIAREHKDFVFGFIAQERLGQESSDLGFIVCTPGVNLSKEGDKMGQHYNTPDHVIIEKGCDVIIVGRGIGEASNRVEEAKRYRNAGWEAYQKRIGKN